LNCNNCPHYRNGKGCRACLNCEQYLNIIQQSGKRKTVRYETMPQVILESLPEMESMKGVLQTIPFEYAMILLGRFFLNASNRELSEFHGVSQQTIINKIKTGLRIIRKLN
jgi:DNA-directed RNA polymerase specialized sigma24 family protein